jgi:hypothetical protein
MAKTVVRTIELRVTITDTYDYEDEEEYSRDVAVEKKDSKVGHTFETVEVSYHDGAYGGPFWWVVDESNWGIVLEKADY